MGSFREFYSRYFSKKLKHRFFGIDPKKRWCRRFERLRTHYSCRRIVQVLSLSVGDWLKNVMGKVVSHYQLAFVKGRQILHAVLLINDITWAWRATIQGLFWKWTLRRHLITLTRTSYLRSCLKLGFDKSRL